MRDGSEVESLVDALDALVDEAEGGSNKWKEVWAEIKSIGQAFKESRFPSAKEQQAAWKRFQALVARVKAGQERARTEFAERIRYSEYHLEQIRSYASRATPDSGLGDIILAICTGGLSAVVEAGLDAILGPFDQQKYELQRCSQALKEGWAYLSEHKGEMLGKHKQQAFAALNSAKESLDSAWERWKSGRQQAFDQYHAERRAAREARHAEKQAEWEARHAEKQAEWEARRAKREAWEARIHENISNLESRIDRLEGVLDHKRSHLSELEDKRNSAWSDGFRDRVDGWISEEESRIADIENQLGRLRSWLEEAKAKLR